MNIRLAIVCSSLVALVLLPAAAPLDAQLPAPRPGAGWHRVRVAKWALLGAALALGGYALGNSNRADDAYTTLRAACDETPARCTTENGRYGDASLEALYDRAITADRRAQLGIIAGEVTLLGSAAFFVYDLRNRRGPANIPYPAARSAMSRGVAVGARFAF